MRTIAEQIEAADRIADWLSGKTFKPKISLRMQLCVMVHQQKNRIAERLATYEVS